MTPTSYAQQYTYNTHTNSWLAAFFLILDSQCKQGPDGDEKNSTLTWQSGFSIPSSSSLSFSRLNVPGLPLARAVVGSCVFPWRSQVSFPHLSSFPRFCRLPVSAASRQPASQPVSQRASSKPSSLISSRSLAPPVRSLVRRMPVGWSVQDNNNTHARPDWSLARQL
jgi:hypothetical protein